MSTKLAGNSFLEVIQKSGLVGEDELAKLAGQLESEGVDIEDPRAVAKALIDQQVITTWQADKLLLGKHKGFFLGPYRMLNLLGKGGMGAVYLAQHEMMKRRCAIKVLPAKYASENSSVLERFYVEAQAVASLDDPNIVRAYDLNKEIKGNTTIHYLVMEYIEGRDIQDTVKEDGVLDYVAMADFTRQAANGLAHAHAKSLIHRDIKPANLLIDLNGTVKILDLGLARFFDNDDSSLTIAYNDTVLGTADYLSPEQALNSHEVDMRTDIYSLGCTCYFMLTGSPPFPDGTVAQRLVAHQVKAPEPLSTKRPDIPFDLVAIIDKMIAKDPNKRYRTADDVAAAMLGWLVLNGSEKWKREHSELVGDSSVSVRTPEPTRASSSPMSDTELELLPLDDENEENHKKAEPATSVAKESTATAETDSQPSPVANELEEETETLVEIDAAALESNGNDQLFGDLNDPDLLSSIPQPDPLTSSNVLRAETLASGSSASGKKPGSGFKRNPQPAEESGFSWTSPPVLIGAGAGVLALVAILLIVFMSGDDPSPQPPPVVQVPVTPPTPLPEDEPSTPVAKPKDEPQQPKIKQKQKTETPDEKQNPKTPEPKTTDSKTPEPKDNQPSEIKQPTNPPKKKQPTDSQTPKKNNKQPKNKQQTPNGQPGNGNPNGQNNRPPEDKPVNDVEKKLLFAGIESLKVQLDSPDKTRGSKLNAMIIKEMCDKMDALNIDVSQESEYPVVKLRLFGDTNAEFAIYKMAAEVQCVASNSEPVTVWKHEDEIGRLQKKVVRARVSLLHSILRPDVKDFMDEFSIAVKAVRNQ